MKASEIIVLSVVGAFLLLIGRSASERKEDEPQRVDVNHVIDAETGAKGVIAWRGSPMSVVSFRESRSKGNSYNVGEIRSDNLFYAETGNTTRRTVLTNLQQAVQVAKRRNTPKELPPKAPEEEGQGGLSTPVITPDYGFSTPPSMGW